MAALGHWAMQARAWGWRGLREALRLLLLVLISFETDLPCAAAESYPEASVKAVYLYRFAGYVEWPAQAQQTPFTIAVIGADDVAEALARLLPDHPIAGRVAQLRIAHKPQELLDARIVYAGAAFHGDLQGLVTRLSSQPTLVVTDHEDGLGLGSMVNFLMTDHRVRFEISVAAAARAGLKINSQLLGVAVRVRTGLLLSPEVPRFVAHAARPSSVVRDPAP